MNWGKNEKWREKISENKILFIFPSNAGRIHFERAFSASLFHDEKPPWNARETMRRMRKVSIVRSMFDMYDIFPDIQDFANKLWKNAKLSAENENGEKRGKKRNRRLRGLFRRQTGFSTSQWHGHLLHFRDGSLVDGYKTTTRRNSAVNLCADGQEPWTWQKDVNWWYKCSK